MVTPVAASQHHHHAYTGNKTAITVGPHHGLGLSDNHHSIAAHSTERSKISSATG
ncbi:MAG: hypothetical protein WBZ36_31370 [Candidatus Nitrosopolaris sp.]